MQRLTSPPVDFDIRSLGSYHSSFLRKTGNGPANFLRSKVRTRSPLQREFEGWLHEISSELMSNRIPLQFRFPGTEPLKLDEGRVGHAIANKVARKVGEFIEILSPTVVAKRSLRRRRADQASEILRGAKLGVGYVMVVWKEGWVDLFPTDWFHLREGRGLYHKWFLDRDKTQPSQARCDVRSVGKRLVCFDYTAYEKFNTSNGCLLGKMSFDFSDAGKKLVRRVSWNDQPIKCFVAGDIEQDAGYDLEELSKPQRKALIDARLGQGPFRDELDMRWGNKCALTGISIRELLRASHIKPWAISSYNEQRNSRNGLLLAAHIDALFDKFLISFSGSGDLLFSQDVAEVCNLFGISNGAKLREKLTAEERKFMKFHNGKFEERKQATLASAGNAKGWR